MPKNFEEYNLNLYALVNGKFLRIFNEIDDHNQEALMSTIDPLLSGRCITRKLDRLIEWRGAPSTKWVFNGHEVTLAIFMHGLKTDKEYIGR